MHKFFNLEEEKQQRILNAALKEFSQKGYMNASTNEIVKEAQISKGLLFHYFQNKKALYLFLYDHFLNIVLEEFFAKLDHNERDFLKILKNSILLKMELMHKYPHLFQFFLTVYQEDAPEVKKELEKRNLNLVSETYEKLLQNADVSLFKEGIDTGRAIHCIIWTMEGFSNHHYAKIKHLSLEEIRWDEVLEEADQYIELLRKSFYR